MSKSQAVISRQAHQQTRDAATLTPGSTLEEILVILLALFLFGIAFRFLHAGTPSVLKAAIAFLLGIVCLFALRKAPTK